MSGKFALEYKADKCVCVCVCVVLQGYARLNNAEAALDVLREFWQQGGEPDDTMFEVLVNLCVRTGEFRKALQVSPHICIATADLQQQ